MTVGVPGFGEPATTTPAVLFNMLVTLSCTAAPPNEGFGQESCSRLVRKESGDSFKVFGCSEFSSVFSTARLTPALASLPLGLIIMSEQNMKQPFILRSFVNSFHYLYQDAEYLRQLAKKPEMADTFEQVRLCRTALLLYIFSLEGLINRAIDHFLPRHLHNYFLEREDKFGIEDKWLLLPLLVSGKETFDKPGYPWSHFAELIDVRNDFVHPKHDRPAYYRAITSHRWEPLPWNEIPKELSVKETNVVYRQTRIPKDPYAIHPEHIDGAKKIVDDAIAELDRLLDGKIFEKNWLRNDEMTLVYPPNAKLSDLP